MDRPGCSTLNMDSPVNQNGYLVLNKLGLSNLLKDILSRHVTCPVNQDPSYACTWAWQIKYLYPPCPVHQDSYPELETVLATYL